MLVVRRAFRSEILLVGLFMLLIVERTLLALGGRLGGGHCLFNFALLEYFRGLLCKALLRQLGIIKLLAVPGRSVRHMLSFFHPLVDALVGWFISAWLPCALLGTFVGSRLDRLLVNLCE